MSANSSNLSTLASPGAEVGFGFVITIPGILANTFAIIFFAKAARKTGLAVHYLLLSLAVTDLFGCFLASYTAATAYLGDIQSPALCNTLSFITSLCPMSTALMACLLALDRYIALCHPFKYASFATRKTAIISVLSCFGASIVLSLLPFIQLGNYYMVVTTADGEVQVICSALKFQEKPHQRIYGVLYGVVGLSIIVIVTASNFLVVKSALSMRKNVVSPQNDDQGLATVQSRYASELKFAKMVTGISVVLLFCWTPFMVSVISHCLHTSQSLRQIHKYLYRFLKSVSLFLYYKDTYVLKNFTSAPMHNKRLFYLCTNKFHTCSN